MQKYLIKKILTLKDKRPQNREIEFARKKKALWVQTELFAREIFHCIKSSNFPARSAELTYISILSLIPFLSVLFTIIHSIEGISNIFHDAIESFVQKYFGTQIGTQMADYIKVIISNIKVNELGTIGFLTFTVTIVLLLLKIEDTFDDIMDFKNRNSFQKRLSKCWILITISPFLFTFAAFKSDPFVNLLSAVTNDPTFKSLIFHHARYFIGFIFQVLTFFVVYYTMPSHRIKPMSILVGSLTASFLFELLQFINILIVNNSISNKPSHIYGTVPLLAVLFFIWLRLIWYIILTGASFSVSYQKIFYQENTKKIKIFPTKGIVDCISIYSNISLRFKNYNLPSNIDSIFETTQLSKLEIEHWLEYLLKKKIIICNFTEDSFYPSYDSLKNENNIEQFLTEMLFEENNILSDLKDIAQEKMGIKKAG